MPIAARTLLLLSILAAAGCSTLRGSGDLASADLTPQQRQWWEENKQRAEYVPGKGYYIEQVGYFDEQGRPLTDVAADPPVARKSKYDLEDFSPGRVVDTTKRLVGGEPDEREARRLFQEGEDLFREKQYEQAKKSYQAAANRWPDSTVEEDALYKLAECEYFLDRWTAADDTFEKLLKKYPNSQHLDRINRRRFTIAQQWQLHAEQKRQWPITPNLFDKKRPLFDTGGRALKTYESVMMSDVRGELSDHAVLAVADAYFNKKRYEEADFRYTLLITDYPQSQHQFIAHMGSLKCKLLKYERYQGPDYDGSGLDNADDLIEQMLLQFPEMKLEDRDFLTNTRAKIRAMKAEEDWRTAEYFAKNKHYQSARIYYQDIARKYPGTPHADWALARIDQYKDKPDVGAHPLQWATRWLEEPDDNQTRVAGDSATRR